MSYIWDICMQSVRHYGFLKNGQYEYPIEVCYELVKPSNVILRLEKRLFPCLDCVVRVNCSELCDRVERDKWELTKIARKYNCCPDCGCKDFLEGPQGGLCTNIMCARCRHKFNIGPFGIERI